jgi:hypothetical protein
MGRLLVTVGSDGVTDWVSMPDGQRFNLGPVSVLSFVGKLASPSMAKKSLDVFLKSGKAMFAVDEDRMWQLLKPVRARWSSSDGSFMPDVDRKTAASGRIEIMTFEQSLTALEDHIAKLNKAAAEKATNLPEGVEFLVRLAGKIKSPNQSKNQTYYNLGEPKVETPSKPGTFGKEADKIKSPDQSKNETYYNLGEPKVETAKLSYDVFKANNELAEAIVDKIASTAAKIDGLVKAGRKFNAAKARLDLHEVSAKVAGILGDTDLTAEWIRSDLEKLASRADQLHGLFANAKV